MPPRKPSCRSRSTSTSASRSSRRSRTRPPTALRVPWRRGESDADAGEAARCPSRPSGRPGRQLDARRSAVAARSAGLRRARSPSLRAASLAAPAPVAAGPHHVAGWGGRRLRAAALSHQPQARLPDPQPAPPRRGDRPAQRPGSGRRNAGCHLSQPQLRAPAARSRGARRRPPLDLRAGARRGVAVASLVVIPVRFSLAEQP